MFKQVPFFIAHYSIVSNTALQIAQGSIGSPVVISNAALKIISAIVVSCRSNIHLFAAFSLLHAIAHLGKSHKSFAFPS